MEPMRVERSLTLVALLMMLAHGTLANDFNIVVKAVNCDGTPLVSAKVSLSGCVDGSSDNSKAKPVYKITKEDGIAAFTRANADNDLDTEDVIQYCWGSAWRTCKLDVDTSTVENGAGITFDTYELLPKSPKLFVRDTCHCNVCKQFPNGGDCPRSVNFPGCNQAEKVIVLRPKTCTVDYSTSSCSNDPSRQCNGQDRGAICINKFCPQIQGNYQFCSYGDAPENRMTLSFACPASGTLSLKASAYSVKDDCGAREGLQVQKVVDGVVADTIIGFGEFVYDVDLNSLSCGAGTVYTVTEDSGIILTDSIQAVFTPSATSGY